MVVRRRSPLLKMKPAATLALGVVMTLTACDRIQVARSEVDHWRWQQRERAYEADMDRIAKDTHQVYQLDYVLSDNWLPAFLDTRPRFRSIQNGQFDMTPWLRENGIEATAITSAIFDPEKRKITITDTGANIALIATIIEPLRPNRYHLV